MFSEENKDSRLVFYHLDQLAKTQKERREDGEEEEESNETLVSRPYYY